MNANKRVRVTAILPIEVKELVDLEVDHGRAPHLVAWIEEAVREKLDRAQHHPGHGDGMLAGLCESDVKLVRKFIDCLRVGTKSRGFRRAVEATFAWLIETARSSPKAGGSATA